MLRSFDYAAFAALFAFTKDRPDDFDRLAPWARLWQTWTSAAFLKAYREAAGGASFLPPDPATFAALLRAFTLDKALYELLYELNNRPDWVRIPLQGILALLEQAEGVAPGPAGRAAPGGRGPETVSASRLSDFDLHLLAEGTHYRSYEKLGAHLAEQDGRGRDELRRLGPERRARSRSSATSTAGTRRPTR